ncbi:hypothetical protein [Dietzia sp. 179-F 9C3 NHS]|uniref:hypothetical protein n=1 Tax=Dietzia sp. 179-F 9C3 NHS TaxID=3374295 RepID=UPI00387A0E2F
MLNLDTGRLNAATRGVSDTHYTAEPTDLWRLLDDLAAADVWTADGARVTVTPFFAAGPDGVGDDTDLRVMVGPVDGATVVVNLRAVLVGEITPDMPVVDRAYMLMALLSVAVEAQLNEVRAATPFGQRLVPADAVRQEAWENPHLTDAESDMLAEASDRAILDAIDRAAGGSTEDQLYHLHDQIQAEAVQIIVAEAAAGDD